MQLIIGVILLSFSTLLSVSISIYFIVLGRRSKLLYSFVSCPIIMAMWSLGHIIEITSKNFAIKWSAVCMENLAICFVGFSWLLFSMIYTENRFSNNKVIRNTLLVIPALMYISFLTNSSHMMFYSIFEMDRLEFGILFWVHLIFVYIYICTGTLMIIKYSFTMMGHEKKQSVLLIVAGIIPVISNILHVSGLIRLNFDITPISFSISLLLFAIATFKYKFLNTMPSALRKVFDTVEASIVLIDNYGLIVSSNNSFSEVFRIYEAKSAKEFVSCLKKNMITDEDESQLMKAIAEGTEEPLFGEIQLNNPLKMIFRIVVQPLFDGKKRIIGRVVSFTDITSYKELADELGEKNVQLTEINEQLNRQMPAIEELAVVKERNRAARDIHDTLGHTLTLLITLMKVSRIACRKNPDEAEEKLFEGISIATEGLKEVRRSISGLLSEHLENNNIIAAIKHLVQDSMNSGVNIEFSAYGEEYSYNTPHSDILYRICQEAITNSLRHGNASQINIILRFSESEIKLFVFDDGRGCKKLIRGVGLSSMEERVKKINGKISYGSDGESGFNIHIEIPIAGGN